MRDLLNAAADGLVAGAVALCLAILFLLAGCSTEGRPPAAQLTGPERARVAGEIVRIDRMKELGFEEATIRSARRQQRAYKAGQRREKARRDGREPTREEILWAARAIHSETKSASVREYVAWVVRNRLRSSAHPDDVRSVVLEPGAFSAFSDPQKRARLLRLGLGHQSRAWQRSVRMARYVLSAPVEAAPDAAVTHFVFPDVQRQLGRDMPRWARVFEHRFTARKGASRALFFSDGSLTNRTS